MYICMYIYLDSIPSRNRIHSRRKTWQKRNIKRWKREKERERGRRKPVQLPGWPCKAAASLCACVSKPVCVCIRYTQLRLYYIPTKILTVHVASSHPIASKHLFIMLLSQLLLLCSQFCIWNLSYCCCCLCCCYFWLDYYYHYYDRDLGRAAFGASWFN